MLRKKLRIQKSFRIDVELDEKIAVLADWTNRPQNDIVNYALEHLFDDPEIKTAYENAIATLGDRGDE